MTPFDALLVSTLSYLLGGIGLFLLGMILLSDGLKAAAGTTLKEILERLTGTPFTAFLSGIGLTAVVQSSSATTVTTIGFVSAGLLSYSASIGVIVGANVGTTSTGWIVSLLGFKLNVGMVALPLIGVGALLRLLTDGRRANLGIALAGFGLIFVGIDFLQEGMGGLAERIDLSGFSSATLGGRLTLVLIGAAMTVLLQSSSAAVALTLTGLHSGAVGMEQAALLVIGQNLGTTVKAVLAAIGAAVPAQRTALAHILFNVLTGLGAFVAVDLLLRLVDQIGNTVGQTEPAVDIALFHTVLNLAGALLILPLVHPFARLVAWLVPDRGPAITRHLDRSVLGIPAFAVEAAARAMREIVAVTLEETVTLLEQNLLSRHSRQRLWIAEAAMAETSAFLGKIHMTDNRDAIYTRRLSLLHAGDHVDRLIEACLESDTPVQGGEVHKAAQRLALELQAAIRWLHNDKIEAQDLTRHLEETSKHLANTRRSQRAQLLEATAAGYVQPQEAQQRLESMRWVDRVAYHVWRTLHHLAQIPSTVQTAEGGRSSVYVEPETEE